MSHKFLLVFTIILVIRKCNGELNVTKKCDEGWQGKDCEFCAGKIRYKVVPKKSQVFAYFRNLCR